MSFFEIKVQCHINARSKQYIAGARNELFRSQENCDCRKVFLFYLLAKVYGPYGEKYIFLPPS